MKKSELITLIKQIIKNVSDEKELLYDDEKSIEEISTTADAGAYDTPKAFSRTPKTINKYEKDGFRAWKKTDKWFVDTKKLGRMEQRARKNSPVNESNSSIEYKKAERHFEYLNKMLKNAKSVTELLEIMASDLDKRIQKDQYIKRLRKEINIKFKGNLEKTRDYFIRQLNTDEHNYFDADSWNPNL